MSDGKPWWDSPDVSDEDYFARPPVAAMSDIDRPDRRLTVAGDVAIPPVAEQLKGLLAENARLRAERNRMYQRALDAESHAAFGPMDVDERVRLLRNLVDVTERERDEARAELDALRALMTSGPAAVNAALG